MFLVSDLEAAKGRMSNARQAKLTCITVAFLFLIRTVTSLDIGKEVWTITN